MIVTNGRYHGSLAAEHGPVRVVGRCDCDDNPACDAGYWDHRLPGRWLLITAGGQELLHVRPESFTRDPAGAG